MRSTNISFANNYFVYFLFTYDFRVARDRKDRGVEIGGGPHFELYPGLVYFRTISVVTLLITFMISLFLLLKLATCIPTI